LFSLKTSLFHPSGLKKTVKTLCGVLLSLPSRKKVWKNTPMAMSHATDALLEDQLPQTDFAVGIPVSRGLPASQLPADPVGLFNWAMHQVEMNEYHGLVGLAQCGLAACIDERRLCVFSCDLKSGILKAGRCLRRKFVPQSLRIQNANLVHYAVCMGAFRAAAALLVICPAFLRTRCKVELVSSDTSTTEMWSAADLVRFFCVLYSEESPADDGEQQADARPMRDLFMAALPVFEHGEASTSPLPFLGLPTVAERIAAAGFEPERVVDAFVMAAASRPRTVAGRLSRKRRVQMVYRCS